MNNVPLSSQLQFEIFNEKVSEGGKLYKKKNFLCQLQLNIYYLNNVLLTPEKVNLDKFMSYHSQIILARFPNSHDVPLWREALVDEVPSYKEITCD